MQNKKLIVPMVMLATLSTLAACTTPTTPVPPVQAPTNTGTTPTSEVVNPVSTGTITSAPSVLTRKEVVSYDSRTPEGMVQVEFDVTVTDGVITAAVATPKTDKDTSKMIQEGFSKEVSAKVVGKKAKNLDVDAVGGASLTTAAFEQFVHSF